jgi:hypothetical protein
LKYRKIDEKYRFSDWKRLKKLSILSHSLNNPNFSMKPTVLFITASIRSHVMPSLFIADLLAEEYNIHYAVTNEILREIVVKNGFNGFLNSGFRPCIGIEGRFLTDVKKKNQLFGISRKHFGKMKFTNTEKMNLIPLLTNSNLQLLSLIFFAVPIFLYSIPTTTT